MVPVFGKKYMVSQEAWSGWTAGHPVLEKTQGLKKAHGPVLRFLVNLVYYTRRYLGIAVHWVYVNATAVECC